MSLEIDQHQAMRLARGPANHSIKGTLRYLMLAVLLVAGLLIHDAARADSWPPPTTQTTYSPNRQWRLTVTPRAIKSPLAYFEDKVAGKPNAGGMPDNLQKQAQGFLEHDAHGQWTTVWNQPLVNEVSPVTVLVSDQGWVATFDNWHSMGYGDNVVVLYGEDGRKTRQLALDDFLSKTYVHGLPHSVSSIEWGQGHHFSSDGKRLILHVVVPPDPTLDPSSEEKPDYVDIAVETATGRVIPPTGPAWGRAQHAAAFADASLRTEEAAADAAFKGPLHAPETDRVAAWHGYLIEAFFRTDPDWKDGYPQTEVLSRESDPYYSRSLRFLRDALSAPTDTEGALMLGSPDQANLIRMIDVITRKLPPHRLTRMRIYVTVTPALREAVTRAIARTGAQFIALDTKLAIEQRPERLQRYLEDHVAD